MIEAFEFGAIDFAIELLIHFGQLDLDLADGLCEDILLPSDNGQASGKSLLAFDDEGELVVDVFKDNADFCVGERCLRFGAELWFGVGH